MGEDPYLTGQYSINFVRGMQELSSDPTHVLASACCKHYVANEMERSTVDGTSWTRHNFDATVSQQDLVDTYMAPFQDCVEQGRVTGLMCSYNSVNGVPSCANPWLLETVARGQWEFDGYVTSDCDADADVYRAHHFENHTTDEVVRDVLRAGTDVDCGGFVQQNGADAIKNKVITEEDLNERLRYQLRLRMRLGHFDPPTAMQSIKPDQVCSDYSKNLAREGAIQGTVLLKNSGNVLPLDPAKVDTTAVIGPNANLSEAIARYYGGAATCDAPRYWNAVDAVAEYVPKTTSLLGVPSVTSNDTSGVAAAAKLASGVDQVFMVVGQDGSIEHEAHDRVSIALSDGQLTLIEAVAKAAKSPIVVVILTGGAVDVAPLLSNAKVGAVLHAGQPSVTVRGVGDLIFGKRVPAGRMLQTVYPAAFADEISIFDFNMRPGPSVWPAPGCTESDPTKCPMGVNPGRTYRFYTGKPTLPFGYGLSYTSFKYDVVTAETPAHLSLDGVRQAVHTAGSAPFVRKRGAKAATNFVVNVTNTGSLDADDVVLGFLTPPGAGQNGVPIKTLFGFERVHIKAGQTVTVYLAAGAEAFTHVGVDGTRNALSGDWKATFGVEESLVGGMGFAQHNFRAV
eukprot:UC1_evm1s2049